MAKSYLDSPMYQRMLAQTLQGNSGPQYPMQAGANALAQMLGAYTLKKYGQQQEERETAGNKALADVLAPPEFRPSGTNAAEASAPISFEGVGTPALNGVPGSSSLQQSTVNAPMPEYMDFNKDKNAQLVALLGQGIGKEEIGKQALKNLGFGEPPKLEKFGESERGYMADPNDPTKFTEVIKPVPKPRDPNKAFYIDENGNQVPNTQYQNYERELAATRRPVNSVTVNAGSSFGSGLGTGAADALKSSQANAQGAAGTIAQGNQILAALDSGKVMAGPATTFKMVAGQLFGGDQEKLNQTRTVIKSLAEITLQSRKMLAGQGQVTNNEQTLLERARSGNVDDMSVGEIRTVVNLNNRISRQVLAQHQKNLAGASKAAGAEAAPFLNMYNVDEPPAYAPQKPQSPPTASGPAVGTTQDGYVFMGGDPADPKSWKKQ